MICHINCSDLSSAMELHTQLAKALNFPEWYGHNLDALYDCLSELPEAVELHLAGWDSNLPWASGFECVLADAQQASPSLTVIFE